jgi:aspartate/methionine/tyrosine aminotransferase
MNDFYRVKRLPPYVFEEVNRLKAGARAAGADIIDLGMGIRTCPLPRTFWRSWSRRFPSRAPTAIRRRAASRGSDARKPDITVAASA